MTPAQIFAYFAVEREPDGRPKWAAAGDDPKTDREYYVEFVRDRCGVWEPAEQARMWRAEQARRRAAAERG